MHWFEAAQILFLILILIQILKQPLHLLALGFHPEKACKSHLGRVRLTHWCSLRIARPLHAQDKNICAKIIFLHPKYSKRPIKGDLHGLWTFSKNLRRRIDKKKELYIGKFTILMQNKVLPMYLLKSTTFICAKQIWSFLFFSLPSWPGCSGIWFELERTNALWPDQDQDHANRILKLTLWCLNGFWWDLRKCG